MEVHITFYFKDCDHINFEKSENDVYEKNFLFD
jgi:hypothetical protein